MFDYAAAREHMIDSQVRTNDVTDSDIHNALRRVPREAFVPASKQSLAYSDTNVVTDEGRVMMRPRDFAKLVQLADIQKSDVVLNIASGRGYAAAVLSHLADTVVGVEQTEEQVERATELLMAHDVLNAAIVQGDLKSGAQEHGPFDVIFVGGAVNSVPKTWLDQLASGGRLVVVQPNGPVGQARLYTKNGNAVGDRIAFDANIPLLPGFEAAPEFVF